MISRAICESVKVGVSCSELLLLLIWWLPRLEARLLSDVMLVVLEAISDPEL